MSEAPSNLPVVVQEVPNRSRLPVALSGFAVAAALFSAVTTLRTPEPPVMVAVSIKSLLNDHLEASAASSMSRAELEATTADFVAAVEASIADLASEPGVVVIASEAVLGSTLPDFTEDVRADASARTAALSEARSGALSYSLPAGVSELAALQAETELLSRTIQPDPTQGRAQ